MLCVVRCPVFVAGWLLFVVRRGLSLAVGRLLLRDSWFVACCVLCVLCCWLMAAC